MLLGAAADFSAPPVMVSPLRETDAAASEGDAADDAAIWRHPSDPARSLIIGTNKQGGLIVFGLDGKLRQSIEQGEPNNVDLREGFPFASGPGALVVASDRAINGIAAWTVDPERGELLPVAVEGITPTLKVYGICLYKDGEGDFYAFLTAKSGAMEQWKLRAATGTAITGERVRSVKFEGQCEGCVADDAHGALYVGEESSGLWRLSAAADGGSEMRKIAAIFPAGPFVPDVEGVTLYADAAGGGYLIVSSQGNSTFCVFDRGGENAFRGCFGIGEAQGVDAVSGTDGIEASAADFGPGLEAGLFVAQDDENDTGNQNFKIVAWREIAAGLKLGGPQP
jgi:3-phytase